MTPPTRDGSIASMTAMRRDSEERRAALRSPVGDESSRYAPHVLALARILERNWPLSAALILVIIIALSVAKSG